MIKKATNSIVNRKPFVQTAHENRKKIVHVDKPPVNTSQGTRQKSAIDTPVESKLFVKSQYKLSSTEFTKAHTRF